MPNVLTGLYQPPSEDTWQPLLQEEASPASLEAAETEDGRIPAASAVPQLWAPLTYEAMPDWRWVDWTRYLFYRYSNDQKITWLIIPA